ncbi:unnamed protein product [Owenia fusiformis]|uniref:Uncharacterized protein n=1 Tax=Owenia fusiformis TaxID=6347 RepID=A0A8J1T5J0_OWEFU|nr:unnamed protein product [Owenia fusiformis]
MRKQESPSSSFVNLNDDSILTILSFCDPISIGRLARSCRRLRDLCGRECVWKVLANRMTTVHSCIEETSSSYSKREVCRVGKNWEESNYTNKCVIRHKPRQMPCLQIDERHLWASQNNIIKCFKRLKDGSLHRSTDVTLYNQMGDICKFVYKDNRIVSGARDGSVACWDRSTGSSLFSNREQHQSDVNGIDIVDNVIVSGSRDSTVKISRLDNAGDNWQTSINLGERVWSLAISPDKQSFASGTSGVSDQSPQPLKIWDLNSGTFLHNLGSNFRRGAGVLDIQYETPHILLTCGYDTNIRLWDLRTRGLAMTWEESYDAAVYCIKSDHHNSIVSGTALYGVVRLWDKRATKPVQLYYSGQRSSSSPVYSLVFDTKHLYVALDRGVHLLNFGIE